MDNMFSKMDFMPGATEKQLLQKALEETRTLLHCTAQISGMNDTVIFAFLCNAACIGMKGHEEINALENSFLEKYFSQIFNGDILSQAMALIDRPITDHSYKIVKDIFAVSPEAGGAYCNLILCFAYCDGVFEAESSQKLSDTIHACTHVGFLDEDPEETPEELQDAAGSGDPDAMFQLGMNALNASVHHRESAYEAAEWFQKAAQNDHSDAQFNLALLYLKGFGLPRDFEKAAYWMHQAADNGDSDAPLCAFLYEHAAELKRQADDGDPQAQADLAKFLTQISKTLDQAGPDDDMALALELAKKSAGQHNPDGLAILKELACDSDLSEIQEQLPEIITLTGTQYEGRIGRIENVHVGDSVILVREPENPYDSNAIDVQSPEGSLGHVDAGTAAVLAPALDGNAAYRAAVVRVLPLSKRPPKCKTALISIHVDIL